MDPALYEIVESVDPRSVGEVVGRFDRSRKLPTEIREVARFGSIATCRVRADDIERVRQHPAVLSLKASRRAFVAQLDLRTRPGVRRSSWATAPPTRFTGNGIIVGAADFGIDFAHTAFRHADGRTRFVAIWDQRGQHARSPARYGYGTVHTAAALNAALRQADPYCALGYHPADSDLTGRGSHGTHVLDIAAGSRRTTGRGVASGSDLIFVHLANRGVRGANNLGDSVRILEAVDFVRRVAGRRPWVVNLSVGLHGGPHDGSTLVEMAFDHLLAARAGRMIVQSAGNYFGKCIHVDGTIEAISDHEMTLLIQDRDPTTNEMEVWYPGKDRLSVEIESPSGWRSGPIPLGQACDLRPRGRLAGRLYHRPRDPNNGDNHIDLFLYPQADAGSWKVKLTGVDVRDGRFHAWVERDGTCRTCQTAFASDVCTPQSTVGTLATGRLPIVVGAYDPRLAERPIAPFSSSGPTRDGRRKPDLLGPGVAIVAAKSRSRRAGSRPNETVAKSGTSMAAPFVAGTAALVSQAAERPLWAFELRRALLSTADFSADLDPRRAGTGYVDLPAAIAYGRALRRTTTPL